MMSLRKFLQELGRYPSAIVGVILILLLVALAIYTLVTIPYKQAITLWRGDESTWYRTPKNAQPKWVNWFRKDDLFVTFFYNSAEGEGVRSEEPAGEGMRKITISFPFEFESATLPQEMSLYFRSTFEAKQPFVSIKWITPDGSEVRIGSFSIGKTQTYRFSQDSKLQRKLKGTSPEKGLFLDLSSDPPRIVNGTYELRVEGVVFEPNSSFDVEFIAYGEVYGWAGTDHRRRDLMISLLWGAPVALAFGLLAALGTTVTTMIIAAIGTWYGGWVDELIQRITEVNLVLPFLPILIMIGTFYSRSIWVILMAVILLSIFGASIKNYRAIFMQIKETPYVEAARAYGASNGRIIVQYLVPRILPLLIPQLVILIPSNVFLEASLAVLGLGDPVLPTWGKTIQEGIANGALLRGQYYWVVQPSVMLMITGLGFAMLGFSLDRIFNPRLREL